MTVKRVSCACCSLLLLTALAGCKGGSEMAPETLGRAGEITASAPELDAFARAEARKSLEELEYEGKERGLREFLTRKSLAAEAAKAGMEDDPSVKQNDFGWKLKSYPDIFWRTQVVEKFELTEEDLRAYVDPQPHYSIATIVKDADEGGLEEAKKILGLLAEGADFAELAKEHSYGLLAQQGGDMGWQTIPSPYIDDESAEVIRGMEVGDVTDPVSTPIGWVLYKLQDFRSPDEVFAAARENAERELRGRRIAEEKNRRLKKFYDEAEIVYLKEREGHPVAVVDGIRLMSRGMDEESKKHNFYSDIETYEKAQKKAVEAYLIVREVERLGLEAEADFAMPREISHIKVLSQVFIRRSVQGLTPEVTDADVKAEYERFYLPEVYTIEMILTGIREKAEEALKRAGEGEAFQDIVAALKEESSVIRGGVYGPMSLADMPADTRVAVEGLDDGEHTGVMAYGSEGAFAVIRKVSSEEIEVPSFDLVERSIRSKLTLKRRSDAIKNFIREYAESLEIVINEKALRSL